VVAVAQRIGCLQLDPVSAVARSPLLVLFSRLDQVENTALDRAAYERRGLFEAWAHERRWWRAPTCRCTAGRYARS